MVECRSVVAIPEAKVKMHVMRWFCFILIWLSQEWCQNCMGNLINWSEVKLVYVFLKKRTKRHKRQPIFMSANCEFCSFIFCCWIEHLGKIIKDNLSKGIHKPCPIFGRFLFLFLVYPIFLDAIQKTLTITSLTCCCYISCIVF